MLLKDISLVCSVVERVWYICNKSANTAEPTGEREGVKMKRGGNQREEQTRNFSSS